MSAKVEPIAMPQVQVAKAVGVSLSTGNDRTGADTTGHASAAAHSTPVIGKRDRSIATMYTYFIQRHDGGPIKIGKSRDIRNRLSSLQGGTPELLVCIAYIEGDVEDELHEKFHEVRVCGEWFAPAPVLMEFIAQHATPASISRPPLTPDQIWQIRAYDWAMRAKAKGRFQKKAVTQWQN